MSRRRQRGSGSAFYSRSEGCWVARVSLGVVNGRRIGKKVRVQGPPPKRADSPPPPAVRAELERLQADYAHGRQPTALTLDAYLRSWLDGNRSVRESTLRSYREHVEHHISPLLGGIPVSRLRAADVERLVSDRLRATSRHGRNLSPSTVGKIVTTLRIALNRGVRRGELPVNVALQVDLPRVEREPVRPMDVDEADALVDAFRDHWLGPVVRLLAGSGLRLGEALSLNQGDVHPGFVRIRKSKTTVRAVPISEDAQEAVAEAILRAPRRGVNEPLFFGPRNGERLSGSTVTHAVPRRLEELGLARLTPHAIRHMAATLMVSKGAHIRTVAEQLGHKNPAMTMRVYAHVIPENQVAAVAMLNRRAKG